MPNVFLRAGKAIVLIGALGVAVGCAPTWAADNSLQQLGQQLVRQAVTALEQKYLRLDTEKKTLALSPDVLRLLGQLASRRATKAKEFSIDPQADGIGVHMVNNLGVGVGAKVIPEELLVGLDAVEINGRMAGKVQVDQLGNMKDGIGGFLDGMLGVSDRLANLSAVSKNMKIEGDRFSFRRPVNVSPVARALRGSARAEAGSGSGAGSTAAAVRIPLRLDGGWLVLDARDVHLPSGSLQTVLQAIKHRLPEGLLGK